MKVAPEEQPVAEESVAKEETAAGDGGDEEEKKKHRGSVILPSEETMARLDREVRGGVACCARVA